MLTIEEIRSLQENFGVEDIQAGIESGRIWKFEGSVGRMAMTCLEAGICFLGEEVTYDYYGNTIPARQMLEQATKGTLENAQQYWQRVADGDFEEVEALSEFNEDRIKLPFMSAEL